MFRRSTCFATLSVLGVVACSSSDDKKAATTDTSGDEISFTPFKTTTMLDAATVNSISASDVDGTVHFPTTAGLVANVKPGTFIVGGIGPKTPMGLMRYVYATTPEGGGVAAKTINAPPQLVFKNLHVKMKRTLPSFVPDGANGKIGPRTLHPLDSKTAAADLPIDVLVFDGDGDDSTTDDQLHLTGDLGGSVTYNFGSDFNYPEAIAELPVAILECLASIVGDLIGVSTIKCAPADLLPDIKTTLSIDVEAHAAAKAEGVAYLSFSKDYQLFKQDFTPIPIGPLVFVPTVAIDAHITGGASSRFSTDVDVDVTAGAGVTASTKDGVKATTPYFTKSVNASHTDVTLGGKIKASIGPEVSVKLYGIAGPQAGFTVYAELDASSDNNPCYSEHLGIDGNVGVDVSVELGDLGSISLLDYQNSFKVLDLEVGSGSCGIPAAGQSKKLPGQGPDDATFQTPAFTPYVKGYAGKFGDYPYSEYEGLGWTASSLAIDGSMLVTGSQAEALTKVKPDDGSIVWSEKLVYDQNIESISDRNTNYFLPSRATNALDGSIMATADPFAIASIEQNGSLRWVKYFDGVGSDDFRRFVDIKPDGTGGFWLIGNRGPSYDETIGWLLHVDVNGNPLSSKTWGDPKTQTYASSLTVLPDGIRVGSWVRGAHSASILTFALDGTFKSATSYTSTCGADITPTASAIRPDGGFAVAGVTNSLPLDNFVLTFDPTGAQGAIESWGAVDELGECTPHISSIVPLNSTGYLVAGSCDGDSNVGEEAYVGGLDAGGRPLWGHAFGLLTTAPKGGAEGRASVRLTDDGGAFITAVADEDEQNGSARLLVAKLFAKDAKATAKGNLETQDPPLGEGRCKLVPASTTTIAPVDSPATVQDLTAHFHVEPVTSTKTDYQP